jgi:hypothetical protein
MLQKSRSSDSALSGPRHAPPAEVPPLDRGRMVGKPGVTTVASRGMSIIKSAYKQLVFRLWFTRHR